MLGTLAKWLRILGYDTAYDNQIEDDTLIKRCLAEDRFLLTRDSHLVKRRSLRGWHVLVSSVALGAQIREVLESFEEVPVRERLFSRCVQCNEELVLEERQAISSEVPPYVYQRHRRFKRCPHCRKVFWRGSHRERMLGRIFRLAINSEGQLRPPEF
jgi:uncharacterized protein with PIN domain